MIFFLFLIGELDFIASVSFDHIIIGGDFNTDFGSKFFVPPSYLIFLQEHCYVCLDTLPSSSINHTYRNDASGACSWIDHFICDDAFAAMAGSVALLYRGANLSNHVPITFTLHLPVNSSTPAFVTLEPAISNTEVNQHTDRQSVPEHHIINFKSLVELSLPTLPADVVSCCDLTCSSHHSVISKFIDSLLLHLRSASMKSLPIYTPSCKCKVPGWNDRARLLKKQADIWYKIWAKCWFPVSGVLAGIRKKTKAQHKLVKKVSVKLHFK